jgi:hypothetical protein
MYKNGISHLTAASDLDGALQIVKYLMFIPGQCCAAVVKTLLNIRSRSTRSGHTYSTYRGSVGSQCRLEADKGAV